MFPCEREEEGKSVSTKLGETLRGTLELGGRGRLREIIEGIHLPHAGLGSMPAH